LQYWTKTKPSRPGYYWVKWNNEVTEIVKIYYSGKTLLVDINEENETHNLKSTYLQECEWGNTPLTEPTGRKM